MSAKNEIGAKAIAALYNNIKALEVKMCFGVQHNMLPLPLPGCGCATRGRTRSGSVLVVCTRNFDYIIRIGVYVGGCRSLDGCSRVFVFVFVARVPVSTITSKAKLLDKMSQ